jgi:integrase
MTARKRRARRSNGEGSVYYETATGRWRGAVVLDDGTRRRVSASTQADALAKLREVQRTLDDGLPVIDGRRTVGDYLEHWLAVVLPARGRVRSQNTIDNYTTVVRLHLIPTIGRKTLRSLTTEDVERVLRQKAAAGCSRSYVNRMRAVLVTALNHAEARAIVPRNVARLAEMPVGTKEPNRRRSLTVDEAHQLLDAAKGDRLEALFVVGLMLGLRPGELCGLRWEDVDLPERLLHVRQAMLRERTIDEGGDARWVLRPGDVKTRRSRRSLTMPGPVYEALVLHAHRQREERDIACAEWREHGLAFTTAFGTPIDPSNLRRAFSGLTERAGLGAWKPYELRHSAVSLLSAAGVPLERIADLTGHTSTRMVDEVYRHAVAPSVSTAVSPMERLFSPAT